MALPASATPWSTGGMNPSTRHPIVIIGIGDSLRRDDGVGPLVIDACTYEPIAECDLVEIDGTATHIVDAWETRDLAIVVDAICTGDAAGTVHEVVIEDVPGTPRPAVLSTCGYTGVAEALRVGHAQQRLPNALVILGIEPGDLKQGFGLSPAVSASMEKLVGKVRAAAEVAEQWSS